MGTRKLLLTVFICVLAAVPEAIASLADVSRQGVMNYDARAGEANRATIGFAKGVFTVTDAGAQVKAGRRCARRPKKQVRCDPRIRGKGYLPNLRVKLGDRHDRLAVKAARRKGFTTVHSGPGDDVIKAGDGYVNGYFYGETGADTVAAGSGTDEVFGGPGPDTLSGGGGRDEMYGGDGDRDAETDGDRVDGGAGNDIVNGADGDDVILGGAGNDLLGVGGGNPELGEFSVDPGADTFDGGPGDDGISGQDTYGPPFADRITCGPGNDRVLADELDVVDADCERVDRKTAKQPEQF